MSTPRTKTNDTRSRARRGRDGRFQKGGDDDEINIEQARRQIFEILQRVDDNTDIQRLVSQADNNPAKIIHFNIQGNQAATGSSPLPS